MTPQDEVRQLRDRVAVLEEQLGLSVQMPVAWGLTLSEGAMFGLLYRRKGCINRTAAMTVLYAHRPEDEPDDTIVRVWISRLRRKLGPFGIEIVTRREQGWYLPEESREAARLQIEEAAR